MDMVKIVHPDAGESMVPASAVPAWRSSGWEVASATDRAEEEALIDEAPPRVSTIANAIGHALTRRGVQLTPADALAVAYHVVDQDPATQTAEAAEQAQAPATPTEPAGEPGNDPAGSDGDPAEPGGKSTQHEAKPERRTRRQSSKGDE